jgi:hypothetical protein
VRDFTERETLERKDTNMAAITVDTARRYVATLDLPAAPRVVRGAPSAGLAEAAFESAKGQAAVVGSDVISFVSGVTAERREDIVNSALLAQLAAKKRVPDASRVYEWYDAYFDVLTNVGWAVQARQFAEYRQTSENFEAHEAILQVAATLLGPATTALAIVKTTLDALRSMSADSPWITLFNRESQSTRAARFQVSLAEQAPDGQFLVSLMAFGLEAKATITQVLFFKARKNDVTLRHHSGQVTIATDVLEGIRADLKAKIVQFAQDYIRKLPDL